ncbi:3'-5' exonuclease [Polaribacter atrinae]|uniref:3'-5' exonuclease n=1 Tax=Polaribacter atrinae TaxID=1333662 RepID=UPI0030F9B911
MGYNFTLPKFSELTGNQKLALEEVGAIALTGGPGTGKTVVSLWRHIRNHELEGINSLLLTYTKTLEFYLKQTAAKENQGASRNINRTQKWSFSKSKTEYDEIIIDEAQDVSIDLYQTIKRYAKEVSYGADDAQNVNNGCSTDALINLFQNNEEYELAQNFRNSREILQFTKAVFPNLSIPYNVLASSKETGIKPFVQVLGRYDFEDSAIENILEIIKEFPEATHNIGILVPSENQVEIYDNLLNNKVNSSKYYSSMPNFESLERIHVTTFKSAKGLEFDTVIIPSFDSYNWFIENTGGRFTKNDYYVALTRAKRNLFLLCKYDINIASTETYNKE